MIDEVRSCIEDHIGSIIHVDPMGGGCIANASRLETAQGRFFLKWGGPDVSTTFGTEATGLTVLQQAGTPLKIPKVIAYKNVETGFLLLEWIEKGVKKAGFDEGFGQALAQLHQHKGNAFGFEDDNFIGRSPQLNRWHSNWPAFFQNCRLEPQVDMARQAGLWQPSWNKSLEKFYRRLPDILPEKPVCSILHGDLWSGNYLITETGKAALFDPACYYGDREADLAMTELFGGFDPSFYGAYRESWPMEPGYEVRREIYNLYHLINHLNLFGGSYAGSVERILKRFQ